MYKTATIPGTVTEKQFTDTIDLLSRLIRIPALSGKEEQRAEVIARYLESNGVIRTERLGNNVWAYNRYFDHTKPTLLLNSHLDTVAPNAGYKKNPYDPEIEGGKLFGLGSNDAGGALVCLLTAFLHFYNAHDLKYNVVYAATAEEEVSGRNGMELLFPELINVECAIVGEPTEMEMAIAEKGLLVLDCECKGIAGHAARDNGNNAIYKAVEDINWLMKHDFPKESETLGKVRMTVTIINSGKQHNIIPDNCIYTIDIRVTDQYTHEEIVETLRRNLHAQITARSFRMRPSSIPTDHPIVMAAKKLDMKLFGSATTSDQALIPVPSVKLGPGNSLRSHTSDEFIYLTEIRTGIEKYINLLEQVLI